MNKSKWKMGGGGGGWRGRGGGGGEGIQNYLVVKKKKSVILRFGVFKISQYILTLCMLSKKFSILHHQTFFLFFSQKIGFDVSRKLSLNLHEMLKPIFTCKLENYYQFVIC